MADQILGNKCSIKIPPIKPIKLLDVLSRRRYVPNTKFYYCDRKLTHPIRRRDVLNEPNPYRLPSIPNLEPFGVYIKKQTKSKKQKEMSKSVHDKNNIKTKEMKDISERLYVPPGDQNVLTVIGIHPEFFSVIEGRPLRPIDDIKVYVSSIGNCAMLRQQVGYRIDMVKQIEQNITQEFGAYQNINNELALYLSSFERFLRENSEACSIEILKSLELKKVLNNCKTEFCKTSDELTKISNIVYLIDDIRHTYKRYSDVLNEASPIRWRILNDSSYFKTSVSIEVRIKSSSNKNVSILTPKDLENEIRKPVLYFKKPSQIINKFEELSIQTRECFAKIELLAEPLREARYLVLKSLKIIDSEIELSSFYLDAMKRLIYYEENVLTSLKQKFTRILKKDFYNVTASDDAMKLYICLIYVYEQIFGKKDDTMTTIMEPTILLEDMYEKYNSTLDYLDFHVVKTSVKECFDHDLRRMRLAKNAARELKMFNNLTESMKRIFLPPFKQTYPRPPLPKFVKKSKKNEKDEDSSFGLTKIEEDNLLLFTEWCKNDDPKPYLIDLKYLPLL